MDVTKWANLVAFDIMGETGFSEDFKGITSGQEHHAIKGIHDHVAVLGLLQTVPWFLNLLSVIPGAAAGFYDFYATCQEPMEKKEKVCISFYGSLGEQHLTYSTVVGP
jgi:hypothetical protein